jgi:hypothetical protein
MDRRTITIDPIATKLRRVGRIARRRMRIEGDALANGLHTDGTLTVRISGLGSPVAGVPDSFDWEADRSVALVIIRSGIDGEDVNFQVGPARFGTGRSAGLGDGSGIRYVAFCYDAAPDVVAVPAGLAASSAPVVPLPPIVRTPTPVGFPGGPRPATAHAGSGLGPTSRERRSILDLLLNGGVRRSASGSIA